MQNKIFDIGRDYISEFSIKSDFDGSTLILTFKDESNFTKVTFDIVVAYEWQFEGSMLDYPSESEILFQETAPENYSKQIRLFNLLNPDIDIKFFKIYIEDFGAFFLCAHSAKLTL